jgi:hypothetical protein
VDKEKSGEWMLCEVCHRVLWVEDGPVCPDCRPETKQEEHLCDEPEGDCES